MQMQKCPKKGRRFLNPYIGDIRRNLWELVLWKIGYYKDLLKTRVGSEKFRYPVPQKRAKKSAPTVRWINHSTFLVKVGNSRFLTDPIWSDRCSPFRKLGPKRRHKPSLSIAKLPKIDFVLISHDHYDHLDKASVLKLHARFPRITWLVPTGVKKRLEKWGISRVRELAWWEEVVFPRRNLKMTAVPAQHFSGRSLFDLNRTLWAGWVVEELKPKKRAKRFYFVGDTGYNPFDFKAIGKKWKGMDLSLIPIGTYSPRKFMSSVHIEPKHAVQIHRDVQSKKSVGMHWKTFRLSDEPLHMPPLDLFNVLKKRRIAPSNFLALEPGHEINW